MSFKESDCEGGLNFEYGAELERNSNGAEFRFCKPSFNLLIVFVVWLWCMIAAYRYRRRSVHQEQIHYNIFPDYDDPYYSTRRMEAIDRRLLDILNPDIDSLDLSHPDLSYNDKMYYDEQQEGDEIKSTLVLREDYRVCADIDSLDSHLCKLISVYKIRDCSYRVVDLDINCSYYTKLKANRVLSSGIRETIS